MWRAGGEQVWATQGLGAVMAESRQSAVADPGSFGCPGSDGQQTAAAACAAEPGSGAESECMLAGEHDTNSQFKIYISDPKAFKFTEATNHTCCIPKFTSH